MLAPSPSCAHGQGGFGPWGKSGVPWPTGTPSHASRWAIGPIRTCLDIAREPDLTEAVVALTIVLAARLTAAGPNKTSADRDAPVVWVDCRLDLDWRVAACTGTAALVASPGQCAAGEQTR